MIIRRLKTKSSEKITRHSVKVRTVVYVIEGFILNISTKLFLINIILSRVFGFIILLHFVYSTYIFFNMSSKNVGIFFTTACGKDILLECIHVTLEVRIQIRLNDANMLKY